MHTQSIVCATVDSHCLEYLVYILWPRPTTYMQMVFTSGGNTKDTGCYNNAFTTFLQCS